MGVGARIKALLKEKNMTIRELSKEADIPLNTLYSITKRDTQNVRHENLEKISAALSVDVDYLANGYSGEFDLDGVTTEEMHALAERIRETTKHMVKIGDYWQKIHSIMKTYNITLPDFKKLIVEFGALLDSYNLAPTQFYDLLDELDEAGFFDPQSNPKGDEPNAPQEST